MYSIRGKFIAVFVAIAVLIFTCATCVTAQTWDDDWYDITGSAVPPTNTGDIYHMGKVGIGTTDPQKKLHIASPDYEQLGILLEPAEIFGGTSWDIDNDGGDFKLIEHVALPGYPKTRLTISGGNIGIGTTSPGVDNKLVIFDNDSITNIGGLGLNYDGGVGGSLTLAKGHPWLEAGENKLLHLSTVSGAPEKGMVIKERDVGIGTYNPQKKLHVVGSVHIEGDIQKTGICSFVEEHPLDPTKEIVYVSLEGPEAGTYIRGTAQLVDGEAVVNLPEHFGLVTSDESLTVQLTPIVEWLQLYAVEKGTQRIVVREVNGKNGQFDYIVQGVRKGYENHEVIRDNE